MSNLVAKAVRASALAFAIAGAINWLFTQNRITLGLIALALILTTLALFIAEMKNKQWSQLAWIWSVFFLPYMLSQIILLDYLVQNFVIQWLIPFLIIYLMALPLIIPLMYVHLYLVLRQL
jgi:hypothetical protein